ncbi:MAG: uroporphyrinogen-III synthase [Aquificaceae bacterium]
MGLRGKRIGVVATRKAQEAVEKIAQLGARPVVEELVKIEPVPEEETLKSLKEALKAKPRAYILTTGEGTRLLFERAKSAGLYEELAESMKRELLIVRGYKTRAELLKEGFGSFHMVESTEGVRDVLKGEELGEMGVMVQLYGEDLPFLESWLTERGARLYKVWTYRYVEKAERMQVFLEKLLQGFYHGVLFTSAYQVSYLFRRAKETGLHREVVRSMNREVFVFAVGRTTARRLFENGVLRVYYPEKERLSQAIRELQRVFEDG